MINLIFAFLFFGFSHASSVTNPYNITKWKAYTPTLTNMGTGATTGGQCFSRRVGQALEVKCEVTLGTGLGATEPYMSFGYNGGNANVTEAPADGSHAPYTILGVWMGSSGSATDKWGFIILRDTTTVNFAKPTNFTSAKITSATGSWVASEFLEISFSMPEISGWSP
jgi:hypothetical protein